MKIIVSMNAFKGSMSSRVACDLVAQGFLRGFPEATVHKKPMADGGDGTLEVLAGALAGVTHMVPVTGPYGEALEAPAVLFDEGSSALIESAKASGLALTRPQERDIRVAQSRGVGQLMLWAARMGVKHIVVGIGGTAMNDCGIGAVQAAGGLVLDARGKQVPPGTSGLGAVSRVSLGSMRETFRGIRITAVTDVVNPLLGPNGSTKVYGPQKGLKPSEIETVEEAMSLYANILLRDLGRDPSFTPMSGAGGGLAAGLWAFFGADLEKGSEYVMEKTGLPLLLKDADLIISGEGFVDSQTFMGKVPYAVCEKALEYGVPGIVLGGGLSPKVLEGYPPAFSALFDSTIGAMPLDTAVSLGPKTLSFQAEQIGKLARIFWLKRPTCQEICAGGVVIRPTQPGLDPEILFIQDRYGMMALPKGHLEPGESSEDAALREVCEETGIVASIIGSAGKTHYKFPRCEEVVHKTVQYYAMEPKGGNIKPQKGESTKVLWVKYSSLPDIKTYPDTRPMVDKALASIR